jgi:hydroxyacyl-ACP dehydratase HTD2-like protein with hotdog domain
MKQASEYTATDTSKTKHYYWVKWWKTLCRVSRRSHGTQRVADLHPLDYCTGLYYQRESHTHFSINCSVAVNDLHQTITYLSLPETNRKNEMQLKTIEHVWCFRELTVTSIRMFNYSLLSLKWALN